MSFHWSDAAVGELTRLKRDGCTATECMIELNRQFVKGGAGLTRNAVIGKLTRLGLSGTARAERSRTARPARSTQHRALSQKPKRDRSITRGSAMAALDEPYVEPITTANDIPIAQRCSLQELRADTCRWPVGDPAKPDFFFCGGHAVTARPYCARHCRLVYGG